MERTPLAIDTQRYSILSKYEGCAPRFTRGRATDFDDSLESRRGNALQNGALLRHALDRRCFAIGVGKRHQVRLLRAVVAEDVAREEPEHRRRHLAVFGDPHARAGGGRSTLVTRSAEPRSGPVRVTNSCGRAACEPVRIGHCRRAHGLVSPAARPASRQLPARRHPGTPTSLTYRRPHRRRAQIDEDVARMAMRAGFRSPIDAATAQPDHSPMRS